MNKGIYNLFFMIVLGSISFLEAAQQTEQQDAPKEMRWGNTPLRAEDVNREMNTGYVHTLFLSQEPKDPEQLKNELYRKVRNIAGLLISAKEKTILLRLKSASELEGDLAVYESEQSDDEILSVKEGLERLLQAKGLIDPDSEWIVKDNKTKTLDLKTLDEELKTGKYVSIKLGGYYEARCGPVLEGVLGVHASISNLAFDATKGWCLVRLRPGYSIENKDILNTVPSFMPFYIDTITHLYGDYHEEKVKRASESE